MSLFLWTSRTWSLLVFWIPDLFSFPDHKLPREEALSYLFLTRVEPRTLVNIWTFDLFLNNPPTFSPLPSLTRQDGLAGWERKGMAVTVCSVLFFRAFYTCPAVSSSLFPSRVQVLLVFLISIWRNGCWEELYHLPKDWDTQLISNLPVFSFTFNLSYPKSTQPYHWSRRPCNNSHLQRRNTCAFYLINAHKCSSSKCIRKRNYWFLFLHWVFHLNPE